MAGPLVVLLMGIAMVVGIVGVGVGVGGGSRAETAPVPAALLAEARRVGRWSWGGLAVGLVAAVALTQWDRLGRGLLLAAPVLGLAVLAGTIGGELAVTGPTSGTRQAGLRARRVSDYLPRRATALVVAATLALVATAVGAIVTGSDDDLGRAGRALTTSCSSDRWSSQGPWPGWFYSGPLLAVVGTGLLLAAIALRAVVNRPRLAARSALMAAGGAAAALDRAGGAAPADAGVSYAGPEAQALDEPLRRWSARRVVAASAMMVALPLFGTATVAAIVMADAECLPAVGRVAQAALLVMAPLAAVLLGWSALSLLIPAGLRARSGAGHRA